MIKNEPVMRATAPTRPHTGGPAGTSPAGPRRRQPPSGNTRCGPAEAAAAPGGARSPSTTASAAYAGSAPQASAADHRPDAGPGSPGPSALTPATRTPVREPAPRDDRGHALLRRVGRDHLDDGHQATLAAMSRTDMAAYRRASRYRPARAARTAATIGQQPPPLCVVPPPLVDGRYAGPGPTPAFPRRPGGRPPFGLVGFAMVPSSSGGYVGRCRKAKTAPWPLGVFLGGLPAPRRPGTARSGLPGDSRAGASQFRVSRPASRGEGRARTCITGRKIRHPGLPASSALRRSFRRPLRVELCPGDGRVICCWCSPAHPAPPHPPVTRARRPGRTSCQDAPVGQAVTAAPHPGPWSPHVRSLVVLSCSCGESNPGPPDCVGRSGL